MRPAMIFKFNRSKDAISNKTHIFSIRKRIRPASPIRSFTVYTYVSGSKTTHQKPKRLNALAHLVITCVYLWDEMFCI